jgi:ERCC4-type nuclease
MPHNVSITLDTSEGGLRGWLQQLPEKTNLNHEALPVGDILFYVDAKPTLLIERKEVGDFRSSVADGRFREQRSRMIDLRKQMPELVIAYMIEGDFSNLNYGHHSRIPQHFLENLVNDLGPKYRICVVRSKNLLDSLRLIGRFENMYRENGPTSQILNEDDPVRTYTIGKKRGLERNQFAACALSLVPGVTREAALSITAVYPSLRILTHALEALDTDTEREQLLVGVGYGNGLKIGKTVAKRISDWLMDMPDAESEGERDVVLLSDSESMSESELPTRLRKQRPRVLLSPPSTAKLVEYSDSGSGEDDISDSADAEDWYVQKQNAMRLKFKKLRRRRSASPKRRHSSKKH